MELDYDYIGKTGTAKRRNATAMHLQNYILLLISRSTVLPINM